MTAPTTQRGSEMLFVKLLVNERLLDAEMALVSVRKPELVIGLSRRYLDLLEEYRFELKKLGGQEITDPRYASTLARELTSQVRQAICNAIDVTRREIEKVESLLESLTVISGYEAMMTLNAMSFMGLSTWTVEMGGLRADKQFLTIDESIAAARELRCLAYTMKKRVFGSAAVGQDG